MTRTHRLLPAASLLLLALLAACSSSSPTTRQPAASTISHHPLPSTSDSSPADLPGIHNLVAFHQGFVSGSQPEGDQGFDSLASLGIKTIISVDGAQPDVTKAAARGIRYIHLPITYSGIEPARQLELARAVRDAHASGPVYIHCHHGKHRSAGAAAAVTTILGWAPAEQGVARMHVSGTSPHYKGLFAAAQNASPLSPDIINAVPADFPSVSKPSSFVQAMVDVDLAFEHLKDIEKAGWTPPPSSPDLVPAAEAGRLADLYRDMQDTSYARRKPADLTAMLSDAQAQAQLLESLLAAGESDARKLSAQFKLIAASCKDCHAKYRD